MIAMPACPFNSRRSSLQDRFVEGVAGKGAYANPALFILPLAPADFRRAAAPSANHATQPTDKAISAATWTDLFPLQGRGQLCTKSAALQVRTVVPQTFTFVDQISRPADIRL
jgi:hypothetical protein